MWTFNFNFMLENTRVDMYLPEYNIAVECDENNHSGYSSKEESKRFSVISAALHCDWIRYDPYSADFDIFRLINQLLIAMQKRQSSYLN